MIQDCIKKLVESQDLTTDEAVGAMNEIMEGQATEAQIAAFLIALRMKGETVEEITGCAKVMRDKAARVNAGDGPCVDIVGTGGDVSHTFNISTAAALIAAGAGVKVAKHGNRSVSSQSGSADVLEELGVDLDAPIDVVERCIAKAGVGFLFAPKMHAAMKYAIGPRREVGVRTVFNLLGPLTNPAGAEHLMIGVFDPGWTEPLARTLGELGAKHALVVHGLDGLDEVSTTGPTQVSEMQDGEPRTYELTPEQYDLARVGMNELRVKDPQESAAAIREILGGAEGPKADIALLNAAAGIYASDAADSIESGLEMARESIGSGAANQALTKLAQVSKGS